MDFQKENIFETKEINAICDLVFGKVESIYQKSEAMIICGSVAKVLSGILPENYEAKDLDFVVRDYFVWRFLKENLQQWFPNFKIEVIERERVILYTDSIAIEFWAGNNDHRPTKQITENIKYIDYGNKI